MSDILIRGMEMPKEPDEWIEIAIFGDGKVIQTGESWRNLENGKCYYATITPEKFFNAVPVPPHGDLIDSDEMRKTIKPWSPEDEMTGCTFDTVKKLMHTMISRASVVIPAEEDE